MAYNLWASVSECTLAVLGKIYICNVSNMYFLTVEEVSCYITLFQVVAHFIHQPREKTGLNI